MLNGKHLQIGKPFANFNDGRSRELVPNWLLCEAVNSLYEPGRRTLAAAYHHHQRRGDTIDINAGIMMMLGR